MKVLWRAGDWVTIHNIRAPMNYHRPVAYNTVATVTGNLCAKGPVYRSCGKEAGPPTPRSGGTAPLSPKPSTSARSSPPCWTTAPAPQRRSPTPWPPPAPQSPDLRGHTKQRDRL